MLISLRVFVAAGSQRLVSAQRPPREKKAALPFILTMTLEPLTSIIPPIHPPHPPLLLSSSPLLLLLFSSHPPLLLLLFSSYPPALVLL